MLVSLKIFALAVIFVLTGGSIFVEEFRKHIGLVLLAAVVSITSTYYLGRSIYNDLVEDIRREVGIVPDNINSRPDAQPTVTPKPDDPDINNVEQPDNEVSPDAAEQNRIGLQYLNGDGVALSDDEAVKWYRLSAEQGYLGGQENLGFMYEHGRGVPKSKAEALKWFRLAATKGNEYAKDRLKELGK